MDKINELPDELLVKILSFLPTKVAVSTSIFSKRWECLWMWQPKLSYTTDFGCSKLAVREFIDKNMSLHRALVIESLHLEFSCASIRPEDIKKWVGSAVSRCIGELSICAYKNKSDVLLLPSSLYTCKSLVTLKLEGNILMDVPEMVSLPSLKTLRLRGVKYSNEEYILGVYSKGEYSLRLLLSNCPVLEDLSIERDNNYDNMGALVIIVPSLQRLSLTIADECSCDEYLIVTPALKYFKVCDTRKDFSYLIEHMPKLEEADIFVMQDIEKLLKSVTTVKRLSLLTFTNIEEMYPVGVFDQLEHLKLRILPHCWLKLLFRLLIDSPKLRVLSLYAQLTPLVEDEQCYSLQGSFVPKCLLKSLQTFEFEGYNGIGEEREFLSFLFRNARRLRFSTILPYIRH